MQGSNHEQEVLGLGFFFATQGWATDVAKQSSGTRQQGGHCLQGRPVLLGFRSRRSSHQLRTLHRPGNYYYDY
jgi:hypothetical protein